MSGGDHTLPLAPTAVVSGQAVQSPYHRSLAAIAIKQEQPSPQHHHQQQQQQQQNGESLAAEAAAAAAAAAAGTDGARTPARLSCAAAPPSLASDADGVYGAMSRLLTLIGNTGVCGRRAAACGNVAKGSSCLMRSSQHIVV